MSWLFALVESDRYLNVLLGLLLTTVAPLLAVVAVAAWLEARKDRTPVWRLHVVRLGFSVWDAGYRHDWMARHWWLDAGRWRVAVIRRHVARRWGLP